jgi:hypothetical protein
MEPTTQATEQEQGPEVEERMVAGAAMEREGMTAELAVIPDPI